MAHPPPYPSDDSDVGADREPTARAPCWVSVMVTIIAILLVLPLVVLHLSGILGPGAH